MQGVMAVKTEPLTAQVPSMYNMLMYVASLKVLVDMQVAQSYGLLLGTLLMNPKTAQTIAAVFMLVYVLVAGFFVRGELLRLET